MHRLRVAASGSALSRRVSEVVGVALFAAALIWLIALATYDPNDPVWFFSTGTHDVPANFAGRVGAFLSELSYQVLGYASYLIPAIDRRGRLALLLVPRRSTPSTPSWWARRCCSRCSSAFLGLTLGRVDFGPRAFRAGGYLGEWLGGFMSEYLSRTGSVIVILALMVAAVILATQFSFGRLFSAIFAGARQRRRRRASTAFRQWREERRKAQQRREVMVKYGKKDTPVVAKPEREDRRRSRGRRRVAARDEGRAVTADERRGRQRAPPVVQKKAATKTPVSPPLPLPEPERVERRLGSYTLPPVSLLDPPKAEQQDRRARADGFGAAARREVPRVLGRWLGRADSSRPGRHDVRAEAGRRREVLEGHRPVRRPLPGDAGRIGADRSHPRQGDGRHPDSESQSRSDLAARAARIRRLHALDVEADLRARQDHSRRAVHGRPGDDAALADRRFDRLGQVGRPQRDADRASSIARRRTMCG